MKFLPAEDGIEQGLYQRLVSEDGKIELGIHPVMYGYRVCAGYTKNQWYEIDWCGGSDHANVEMLYSIAKNILENKGDFIGIPSRSNIKPFFNDVSFVGAINSLVIKPLQIVKLNPLWKDRYKLINNLHA